MCTEPMDFASLISNETIDSDPNAIEISLNNNKDLLKQLDNFKEICNSHERNRKRDCKKRFCRLGLVARITGDTTDKELAKLLSSGTLTFLFDSVAIPPKKLSALVDRTHAAVDAYQSKQHKKHVVVGFAFEILGDCCRLGRCRNDCSLMLCCGDVIALTTDPNYEYCGYKEVCYVKNLDYFLSDIKLRDTVKIGSEASGCVVKIMICSVIVHISKPGLINSYDYVTLPNRYQIRFKADIITMIHNDLKMVDEQGGQYIVLNHVRSKLFLKTTRDYIARYFTPLKIIGSIDFEYIASQMIDLCGIIAGLDKLWIRDYFQLPCLLKAHILEFVIPRAKYLHKPIIASVPLQCRYQYKGFLNHPFLWLIDTIFIERSRLCFKYPLIVRQLLTIQNVHRNDDDSKTLPIKKLPSTYETRIGFIISSISHVACKAIFLYISCKTANMALRYLTTCTPVYVMLPWDYIATDENNLHCMLDFARSLNFRRNLRPLLYSNYMNPDNYSPLQYGIKYARSKGCIKAGDFIITAELIAEDPETESAEDFVKLHAFFLN